jgi:endonuclease/exonuclease/phosphatase family metal-dependent hydrolase
MVSSPVTRPRSVVTIGIVLALAAALLVVASPVEAARRPAPTALRATADQGSLAVRWRAVRKAPGYRVRWSERRSMKKSHHLATTRHRIRIDGLAPDTRYFVQVAVAKRKGHGRRIGPWSRILVRRTPPPPCPTVGDVGDPTPALPTGEPTDIRVATFNIRTITQNSPDFPEQRWGRRAGRVAALLLGAATTRNPASPPPDVIAVQEANQSYRKYSTRCTNQMIDLRNRLSAGAGRHYEATSLDPSTSVGTRILFDTTRLRLERSGSVLLAPAGTTHPHLAWAVFQARNGGQRFFFGSVHLVPNEAADSNLVRDAQWDRLLAVLADPALTEGLPVVLGGDFNSRRSATGANTSALTHLPQMAGAGVGDLLLGDLDPANRELDVSDARAQATANAHCRTFNGFRIAQRCDEVTTRIGQHIDYLFASNALPVRTWELVLDLDAQGNWLGTIPSDHNLVRATISLPAVTDPPAPTD